MFNKITERLEPLDVITLTQAKYQLNIIDFDDDDAFISSLVAVAAQLVEKGTNRLLSRCTVEGCIPGTLRQVFLPYGNVSSVTSVKVGETDLLHTFSEHSQILSITDTTVLDSTDEIIITFDAGYDDSEIPAPLKQAALIILSNLYEHREDAIEANLSNVPLTSRALMQAYRLESWS